MQNKIKELDNELYNLAYSPQYRNDIELQQLWDNIKHNDEILECAIKVIKNKFGEDIFVGLNIVNYILMDYKSINPEIYYNLINTIYSNVSLASITINGYYNSGDSFLNKTLWNSDLLLTDDQKNIILTSAKKSNNYNVGPFGIGYYILKNISFSAQEKQQLIFELYPDDCDWEDFMDSIEWNIINDSINFNHTALSIMRIDDLYYYTYDQLVKMYENKEDAKIVLHEINFCRSLKNLRKDKPTKKRKRKQ